MHWCMSEGMEVFSGGVQLQGNSSSDLCKNLLFLDFSESADFCFLFIILLINSIIMVG